MALVFVYYTRRRGCSVRSLMDFGDVMRAARKGDVREMSKRAEEVSEDDNTLAKYLTKLKIVVALYQIIGSMDAVMPQVPFPEALSFVFTFTRFFNLSLLSMLPLECFESVNYFHGVLR